jgi:hypothetical protein
VLSETLQIGVTRNSRGKALLLDLGLNQLPEIPLRPLCRHRRGGGYWEGVKDYHCIHEEGSISLISEEKRGRNWRT